MNVARHGSKIALLVLALAAFAGPGTAQDSPFQMVVGVTPGASYSSIDGFDYQQGFSLGLGYFVSSRWAAEVRTTLEGYSRTSSGNESTAYAIDLAGHYYVRRGPRWGLFTAAGLRFVDSDFGPPQSRGSATGILLGLGADYSVSRRFSLRFDATTVPIELDGGSDRLSNFGLGLGFGFRF